MRLPWIRFSIATLGALMIMVSGAAAQDADKAKARQLVSDGLTAVDEARYDQAIQLYEEAYELVPHPEILFNLGSAYRLKGEKATAIRYYRKYLAVDAKGRVAKDARSWVGKLEQELAQEEARALEAARVAEEARQAEIARRAEEARQAEITRKAEAARQAEAGRQAEAASQAEEREAEAGVVEPVEGPGKPGRTLRIAGIASGALGVVLVGIGVKFGLDARGISDELSNPGSRWTDELLARQDEGQRAETTMFVLNGIGAAAVVAGGALYYLGHRSGESSPTTAVVPTLGGRAGGLAVIGTF